MSDNVRTFILDHTLVPIVPTKLETVLGVPNVVVTKIPNALISAVYTAYANHLPLKFGISDLCVHVQFVLATNINTFPGHYREHFTNSPVKETLKLLIERDMFHRVLHHKTTNEDVNHIFSLFLDEVSKKTAEAGKDLPLINTFIADFTDTTQIQSLVSKIMLAYGIQNFYDFGLEMMCGFPSITFTGTKEDLENMLDKLRAFKDIAHTTILGYITDCEKVITIMLGALDDTPENRDVWRGMFIAKDCGCGDPKISGWLCPLLLHGVQKENNDALTQSQATIVDYQFQVIEEQDAMDDDAQDAIDDDATKKPPLITTMCIRAGQVGAVYTDGMITVGTGYELTESLGSLYAINGTPIIPTIGGWWKEPNAMKNMTYDGTPVIQIFQEMIKKEHDRDFTVCSVKYNNTPFRVCVSATTIVYGTTVQSHLVFRLHQSGIKYEKEWPAKIDAPHVLFTL